MLRTCPRCKWAFHHRKKKCCPGCGMRLWLPSDGLHMPEKDFWAWDSVTGWHYVADRMEAKRAAVESLAEHSRKQLEEVESRLPSMKRIQ
jgi:hypothetical protein